MDSYNFIGYMTLVTKIEVKIKPEFGMEFSIECEYNEQVDDLKIKVAQQLSC